MYSEKRRREAVDLWFELYGTISVEDFVAELGYPCASTMSRWIKADPRHDPDRARYDSHPVLTKLQAVSRVAEGASLAQAARESGLAPSAVWRAVDRHARGGTAALLPGWKGEQVAGGEKGEGRRPSPAMQAPPLFLVKKKFRVWAWKFFGSGHGGGRAPALLLLAPAEHERGPPSCGRRPRTRGACRRSPRGRRWPRRAPVAQRRPPTWRTLCSR